MSIKQKGSETCRMPAEWELHEATWLSWPHDQETWPRDLSELESVYLEMIQYLHTGEKVNILAEDKKSADAILKKLLARGISKNVFIHLIKTNSPWIRDYGPIFVGKKGERIVTDWMFNAWGKKYAPFDQDDSVPERMSRLMNLEHFPVPMVLEGGSVEVNGLGTCITTKECLLHPNRNPNFPPNKMADPPFSLAERKKEIEKNLSEFLGSRNTIWLQGGIAGDDTDGHVDEVARFVDSHTIVAALEEDSLDPNHQVLKENRNLLSKAQDQDGNPFKIIDLPMPKPIERNQTRFPASYLNFYIANECVLVPVFGDKNDTKALGILKSLFSARMVIGIPAFPLVYGQGAIHCITQQEPAS